MKRNVAWSCSRCGFQGGVFRLVNAPENDHLVRSRIAREHGQQRDCASTSNDITFWKRFGECNGCGHCCRLIATIEFTHPSPIRTPGEERFLRTRGYTIDGQRAWMMADVVKPCPELVAPAGESTQCRVYEDRPETCVEFPTTPAQVRYTPCSYWFENEDGRRVGGEASPVATARVVEATAVGGARRQEEVGHG